MRRIGAVSSISTSPGAFKFILLDGMAFSIATGVAETWHKVLNPQSPVVDRLVENADGSSIWERAPSDCKDRATP
jgi:hypothetical protein